MSSIFASVRRFASECVDEVGKDFDVGVDERRMKILIDCRVEKLLAVAGAVAALALSVAIVVYGIGGVIGVTLGVVAGSSAILYCHDQYQYNNNKELYYSRSATNIRETFVKRDPREFKKNTILFGDLFATWDRAASRS